nr:hypothetical protein Q903MT_gene3303 [Picea sitchensis]
MILKLTSKVTFYLMKNRISRRKKLVLQRSCSDLLGIAGLDRWLDVCG